MMVFLTLCVCVCVLVKSFLLTLFRARIFRNDLVLVDWVELSNFFRHERE
jgi:hypothetical protein